jgi:hypothetical protein
LLILPGFRAAARISSGFRVWVRTRRILFYDDFGPTRLIMAVKQPAYSRDLTQVFHFLRRGGGMEGSTRLNLSAGPNSLRLAFITTSDPAG